MSRALQINSSPQGWMARNTKPVPLAEKGMGDYYEEDKYYLIIRSTGLFQWLPVMVVRKKADNQTEKTDGKA